MQIHNVQQGSDAWHDLRNKCFTASEAPAMMGCGWISREELLFQKKTGITPEIDDRTKALFHKGHAAEADARPGIEAEIGESLYPATATHDDYDWLLASFDGVDMMETIVWEHKLWNEELAKLVRQSRETGECQLTGKHYWQLEQQLLVSGAEKVVFTVSDGTEDRKESFEYFPVPGRAEELMQGWEQFRADLEVYQPPESKNLPTANVISDLPVITYTRDGLVVRSDFDVFKQRASQLLERAKQPMKVDQDFADGKELVKVFDGAEKALKGIAGRVIAEVSDINKFRTDLLDMAESIRRARLDLNKRVETELNARKSAIQNEARQQISDYVSALEKELQGLHLPRLDDGIVLATKGKRTLDTFQQSANDAVASAKIAYQQQAFAAQANLKTLDEKASEYKMLFPDLAQIAFKHPSDFANLVDSRIAQHKAAEEARLTAERERIRMEEEAKAKQAAEHKARIQAEQKAENNRQVQEAAKAPPDAIKAKAPVVDIQSSGKTVTIPESRYSHMIQRLAFLDALEACGVDNWEGYEEALSMMDQKAA